MSYGVGDVINIPWEKEDVRNDFMLRIGIIVEDLEDQIEVIFVTKNLDQQSRYPDSFIVLKDSNDGRAMGLTYDSLIAPIRTTTLKKIAITPPPRGSCPPHIITQIFDFFGW